MHRQSEPRDTANSNGWRRRRLGLLAVAAITFALPVLGAAVPDRVAVPIVKAHDDSDPLEPGVFSHWRHDQFRCYACHPTIFPQAKRGFTHADMRRGAFCGACHNGRLAWRVDDDRIECESCHLGASKEPIENIEDLFKD